MAAKVARPRRIRAFGIDPGSVNMGLAEYDVTRRRWLSLERVQFRAPGTRGGDIGQARLIKAVADWVSDNLERFHDSLIFIENQPPKAYGEEGQAVQHAFQTLFQDRCIPINAAAMKAHFAEQFPRHPKYATFNPERAVANQKEHDRKSAIIAGRKMIPKAVCDEYELKNPSKKDDAFEAAFYALFGAERMIADDGSLRDKPLPPRRRKRGEVHPRGRPSGASAAAPKRVTAPKRPSVPKRATTPKSATVPKRASAAAKRASAAKRKQPMSSSDDSTDTTEDFLTDPEDSGVIDLTRRPTKRQRK